MHIIAVGLNYRTAPVEIREQFTFPDNQLSAALQQFKQTKSVLECVIVSTCNRTELYAVVDQLHMCAYYVRNFLEQWFHIPRQQMKDYLYIHEDRHAIEHLFRVTCGLDSMVIGETQILGQVRDAFLRAQAEKATGTIFNTLFKQAVTLAKRAHSETTIGENPVSVSYAAVELGKRIFGDFRGKNVLIVGAGKMSELTLKHLSAGGAERVAVVNRTMEKAVELAGRTGGIPRSMEQLDEELAAADIVISSTGAAQFVLTRDMVRQAMRSRKSRPLFMIDIAVPRDMEPSISDLSNVYLYDIDDLELIVESNLDERRREAKKIERMIEADIAQFEQWSKLLGLSPIMSALQQKSNAIHEETMNSMLGKLPDLSEREVDIIRKLTKSMMNQMLRDPIIRVKELAVERNGDEALNMFSHLFALEPLLAEAESAERAAKETSKQTAEVKEADQTRQQVDRSKRLSLAGNELFAGSS